MASSIKEQFEELYYYTLSHPDKSFIHQHVVDVQAAQLADKNTKPITIIFALAGLYLYIEKKYTGRQVQLAHVQMSKNKITWTEIKLPIKRGDISVSDILETQPGPERDKMIHKWCIIVWKEYKENRDTIIQIVDTTLKK